MPDLLTLLTATATALRSPSPSDWASIASLIGLRYDGVRSIGQAGSATAIEGGTLINEGAPVSTAWCSRRRVDKFHCCFPTRR